MRPYSIRSAVGTVLLLAALAAAQACGGPEAPPPADAVPELTDEKIREALYDAGVDNVPAETGAAGPISWYFGRDEPLDLSIVERQMDGRKATVVVDVTTGTAPRSRRPKKLSGRLRLYYELQTEFILRRWRIVDVDNVSMKYRDEPRPDAGAEEPRPDGGSEGGARPPVPAPPVEPRTGPS